MNRVREILAPFRLPLILTALHLALFTVGRLALLVFQHDDFSSLSGGQVFGAFLRGLRFDASIVALVAGLPLLALMLPLGPLVRKIAGWACYATFVVLLFMLASDVIYFGYVHRHAGLEVTEPGDTLLFMSAGAMLQYVLPVLAFLGTSAGLFFLWRRLLRAEAPPVPDRRIHAATVLAAAVLLFFAERGTMTGKRLRIVHAFQDAPPAAAHLALNGPYSVFHSLYHARAVKTNFYPWPEAAAAAQKALLVPAETPVDPEYPLLRSRPARDAGRPNIVVILLESWDAGTTDAHRREIGLGPLGYTPGYDAAAREGLLFSRFYACGQRSMDGISALLCGFPTLPGVPYLGRGLEQTQLTALGRLAKAEGYDPWYIMSSERNAFRLDAIAGMNGFDHYVGAEDIPAEAPVASRKDLKGACWDHEMFAEAGRRLATAKPPFLAFVYTSTTHYPFAWPDEKWKRRPGGSLEDRYLNSLAYADWALGRFFETSKSADWFKNTIFLVTSDHIGGPGYGVKKDEPATLHHIPCFVRGPGIRPGVDRRIGSQLDLIPTIVELAGWGGPYAALGTSLFSDPAGGRGALCVAGSLVLRVEDGGFVLHSLADRSMASGADADGIERRLLSVAQAAYTLLRTNRLSR